MGWTLRGFKSSKYKLKKNKIVTKYTEFKMTDRAKIRMKNWLDRYPEVYSTLEIGDGLATLRLSRDDDSLPSSAMLRIRRGRFLEVFDLEAFDLAKLLAWLTKSR